jgi:hypothetical protein
MLEKNLQIRVPPEFHDELEILSKQVHMRVSTLARLILLRSYKNVMREVFLKNITEEKLPNQQVLKKNTSTDIWTYV